jgi:hypothetical protein
MDNKKAQTKSADKVETWGKIEEGTLFEEPYEFVFLPGCAGVTDFSTA